VANIQSDVAYFPGIPRAIGQSLIGNYLPGDVLGQKLPSLGQRQVYDPPAILLHEVEEVQLQGHLLGHLLDTTLPSKLFTSMTSGRKEGTRSRRRVER